MCSSLYVLMTKLTVADKLFKRFCSFVWEPLSLQFSCGYTAILAAPNGFKNIICTPLLPRDISAITNLIGLPFLPLFYQRSKDCISVNKIAVTWLDAFAQ